MIKTEFIELYEELNSLNEAVSPEAQAFYKSLNVRTKDPVDTESFIKAFKKDIPDNIWDKLFDDDMKLKNKGTYGIIKNEPLPAEVTAALKKYWAFQYVSNVTWFETTTMIAKAEAERKRKEDDCRLKIAETEQRFKTKILPLIDKLAIEKLFNLYKEEQPTEATKLSTEIRFVPLKAVIYELCSYYGTVEACNIVQPIFYDASDQEVADSFNKKVLSQIKELEEIKAERLAKQNRQEKYKNAKWYSEEFEKWASANSKGIFLFQLSEDEGVQRFTKLSWDLIERCHFTDDVELIAVIISYSPEKRNSNSATENGYYYEYYSVNSKANPADLEDEGILLDPSKFVDDSSWGRKTYKEISSAAAERDPHHYFISGMDKWFEYESVSYSSD